MLKTLHRGPPTQPMDFASGAQAQDIPVPAGGRLTFVRADLLPTGELWLHLKLETTAGTFSNFSVKVGDWARWAD